MRQVTVLILATVILAGSAVVGTEAKTWPVPELGITLKQAVEDSAAAGDSVLVSNQNVANDPYAAFTMTSGVRVLRVEGQEPKIDAGAADFAVAFPAGAADTTILEGFTITGGDSAVVLLKGDGVLRDCAINTVGASTTARYGIQHTGDGTIEDVAVTLNSADDPSIGIYLSGYGASLDEFEVLVTDGTYGVRVDNEASVMNGFVLKGDIGIFAGAAAHYTTLVQNCTVDSCYFYGIELAATADAKYCIATNSIDGSDDITGAGDADSCIAYPWGYYGGVGGSGHIEEDPLYCSPGDSVYTLRVDSYGNPENNASGEQIGAFGVECMYGTLIRDATFAGSGTLAMMDSVIVPAGKKLTLGKDTVVNVDAFYPPVPLQVYGTLHVNGEDGDEVVLQSSESLEGYWQGIRTEDDAKVRLEYAVINHAVYGVHTNGCDSVEVRNCTFASNSNHDIRLTSVQASAGSYAVIEDNVISVGGGSGINLIDHSSGVTLSGNTITGDESSTAGIISGNMFSDTLTIEGNTIEGFSNGSGVWLDCGTPTFVGNTVQDSKYGFTILGGAPKIGTSSSSSDNTITGNTTGIQHDAATATAVILNNQINSNTFGVVNKSGDPNLGGCDGVGNGNNTLSNNSTYCLWNRSRSNADTIWAQGNYYGTCSGGVPPTCWSGIVNVTSPLCTAPSAVIADIIEVTGEPRGFRILGAWPNPMAASNEITFSLKEGTAHVGVQIFDVAGRLVRDIPAVDYGPGVHAVHWDGRNRLGAPVQGGIYFIRVAGTAGLNATAKVLVAR